MNFGLAEICSLEGLAWFGILLQIGICLLAPFDREFALSLEIYFGLTLTGIRLWGVNTLL